MGKRWDQTDGDLAGQFAAAYGLTPDEWQQVALDEWLALDAEGQWVHLTCGLTVPRQNGKNAVIEMREMYGIVGRGERVLHTAHQVRTSMEAFRRLLYFFGDRANDPTAQFPELNAKVKKITNVNGRQGVYLKNGGAVEVSARSKSSSRGFTVDVLVVDEAQEMTDPELEALMPTTSAAPLGNPQWIFTGTPPSPEVSGEVFTRTRHDAMSGSAKRLSWLEWSADAHDLLDDPAVWRKANPALVTGRLQKSVVEGERSRFSDASFSRERLGMWSSSGTMRVIPEELWDAQADVHSVPTDALALAVDVSPARDTATVALAGQRSDGRWHTEVYEQRKGVEWLVPYLSRALDANPSVRALVIDAAGPAASIIDEMRKRKYKITITGSREMASACGRFYDGILEGWLHHTDQPQLTYSLSEARKRPLGDSWAWNRKESNSDITPVVACTLALWGAQNSTVRRPARRSGRARFQG